MKTRPIPFSIPMVAATIAGTKTQTRRTLKRQPVKRGAFWEFPWGAGCSLEHMPVVSGHATAAACPYGQPGDRLWVREPWKTESIFDHLPPRDLPRDADIYYLADGIPPGAGRYRHARFMPRWVSRIMLEVVSVRVERLQEISEGDAIAEGGPRCGHSGAPISGKRGFRHVWQSINGSDSWDANPWVWVIEYQRHTMGRSS